MTNDQIKDLQDKLWDAANALRAYGGIKASDYAVPVLGLIFLKFADNKYSLHEDKILEEYTKSKGKRTERSIQEVALSTCGFYLPDEARYNHLLTIPGDKSLAKALRSAMEGIEKYQDAKFQDVLPTEAYFEIEKKKEDILPQLLKAFSDIPKDASGDVFGKIYEYFLGKFALSEGQKGGEFFTPTSVVRFIVEVIEPYSGKIFDPACGSGGMFVQSAGFIKEANKDVNDIYVYGQEYMGETVRLAKMNLLVNNIRGEIAEVNSYETDAFNSMGKFDYVMANPPFNVSAVKESTVKNDERFYKYGLPKTKSKKDDKISNANYLWASLFATSLNENGRAGFVMANSASDARSAEKDIRQKIVDSGIVDVMVTMPSNMFFTVTLPATLWFYDKAKVKTDRKDKILFIDARNVYRQIDRAHREWTEEQQQNLATIVRLYRGEIDRFLELVNKYLNQASKALEAVDESRSILLDSIQSISKSLKTHADATKDAKRTPAKTKTLKESDFFENLKGYSVTNPKDKKINWKHSLDKTPLDNKAQHEAAISLKTHVEDFNNISNTTKQDADRFLELWKIADKSAKLKTDKLWSQNELTKANKQLEETLEAHLKTIEELKYWQSNIEWLQSRFPKGKYEDIIGLCKIANGTEYVDEQEYSLNAGRYVGIALEVDNLTAAEFKSEISEMTNNLMNLNKKSSDLEELISKNLIDIL